MGLDAVCVTTQGTAHTHAQTHKHIQKLAGCQVLLPSSAQISLKLLANYTLIALVKIRTFFSFTPPELNILKKCFIMV